MALIIKSIDNFTENWNNKKKIIENITILDYK